MNKRCLALSLFALASLAEQLTAKPPLEETFEKTYPLAPNATVSVRNTDGTIYLYGSLHDELKISARKKAYSKARLDGISIDVSINGNTAMVETVYPPTSRGLSFKDRSGTVDYIIVLPQSCTVSQVELANGEIILSGLRGRAANARLTNGILMALDCFTALHLDAEQGRIDVYYNWWEEGAVSLFANLKNGELRVALPPEPTVRIDAESVSGHITNQFGQEHGQKSEHSLQTTIGADDGAEFQLRTEGGNIHIDRGYR